MLEDNYMLIYINVHLIVDATSMPFHWEGMKVLVAGGLGIARSTYYRGYSLNPLALERECISINVEQPSLLW